MNLNELMAYRNREDLRLDELVDVANGFLKVVVPEQPSERVTESLNERTLRYYIAEGLVDRARGKEGTAALYSFRHLVQLLAVKSLQGHYLPIKRIREVLAGKTNEELEKLLLLIERSEEPIAVLRQSIPKRLDSFQIGRMATLSRRRLMLQEPEQPYWTERVDSEAPPTMEPLSPAGRSWERFVLGDGVELHVRSDRKGNLRGSEIRRVVERILQSLKGT